MFLFSKDRTQVIDFSIPEKYKKLAVNCSGGADSGILLYMLAKKIKDENLAIELNVLTCSNHIKDRWNGRKAESIINFICENVGSDLINMHYVYYRDKQHLHYFHEIETKLFNDNRVDLIISGKTSNPPRGTIVENIDGHAVDLYETALQDRMGKNHIIWHISTENKGDFWTPFVNVDKKFVADMYDYFNVRETLLPLTRSCEKKTKLDDPFDPQYENVACGHCWWCLERKWAFGNF